ncbi:MAG: fatty acid oxidation complex subunit alpha FadB [Salinisphaeraceae bacterium]|nr:fatty acid oxidation complex subunit alpha FadB [Salinisphaeraceae bacterium]
MLFDGTKLTVNVDGDIAVLKFDARDGSVNKFDQDTVQQLGEAAQALKDASIKGLLVTSGKSVFIVGADITEFGAQFKKPTDEIVNWVAEANKVFNAIEDLPVPTVTAINGVALGGGFEMCMSTDYRVMSSQAVVGLPETKLGLIPGFGGTVRLARLIGIDNAIEWIAAAGQQKPAKALKMGAVQAVVEPDLLEQAGRDLLQKAIDGEFDWQADRAIKTGPVKLNKMELTMAIESARGMVMQQSKGQYPAPVEAVDCIAAGAHEDRAGALKIEHASFAKLAKTSEADALIGLFLNDQYIKKTSKGWSKQAREVKTAAVLGAGIMGGGIAYQSALRGVPILMKDINDEAIGQGMDEAAKHFEKRLSRGKMDARAMATGMGNIRPTLTYGDFAEVDVVVEAVTENPKIKKSVLAETEQACGEHTIIASNTSSISIDELAGAVQRPGNFLGMHFFNPVHAMPLVEVIRGDKTSEEAIATIVAYASRLGKTPIVVNNCPGFLVNRILFPYFFGFQALVSDGADFAKIDKVMEKFGWPMGPAYLSDVVGMDTSHHVGEVLAEGYPDRMAPEGTSSLDLMVDAGRLGQKSGSGYYKYEKDRKGKPRKTADEDAYALVAKVQENGQKDFDAEEIIDRMMLPMIIESARCLEQGIVDTPVEVDMGMIMGTGFPPFRGGPFKYADSLGLAAVCEKADRYQHLGKLYEPTEKMRAMAEAGEKYHG